jgi:PhoH-like ATPase
VNDLAVRRARRSIREACHSVRSVSQRVRKSSSRVREAWHGGTLRIAIPERRPDALVGLSDGSQDLAILQTAIEARDRDKDRPTIFVTMDTNLRIRADALGVSAETYENQRVEDPESQPSVIDLEVPGADVDAFFQYGHVLAPALATLFPNAAVMLRDSSAPSHTALGRYDAARGEIMALRVGREGVMGVRPRDREQAANLL